ncbi:M43 family zinc metalloprotease [Dyadobacter sp. LHD-138]|uniref:M43 family zinc metalloprotease n=1 Tax=Dyadobacter sp. LHD-138 TaxID=3071413 RepID=UPI0027DF2E92|nr:M43 family zinc metalloprotease [Dyadobacter sp. LHD-138]MDQ6482590.1 M43 family zinc metalloprotease [Dyadobacter sp. LHD-138]
MRQTLFFLMVFLASFTAFAQNQAGEICASSIDYEKLRKHNPTLYNYLKEVDRKAEEYSLQQNRNQVSPKSIPNTGTIVTIPVIVHVIHNGEAVGVGRNISDAQIQSQIDVLNEDFRRLNADRVNTPAHFAGVAADVGIHFRLACIDPNGNPTNGIRRIQGNQANYQVIPAPDGTVDEGATGIKQNDAPWNREQYLNIWTANITNGILGYATFPGSPANFDGVVMQYDAFGRTGTLQANYDKGRVATHEVGHWLSLRHIWGDDGGLCTQDDFVADTPLQGNSNFNCPSGQLFSCGTSNMYMNYMDYTNDGCRNLFTAGQRDRMKALFLPGNARSGFISWGDISGNATICDNNNYTYSIPSSGTSFTWTVSNLTIVSGQGTNTLTVKRTFNGPATISVRSQGLCSSRSIAVGPPQFAGFLVNGQSTSNGTGCTNSYIPIAAVPNDPSSNYYWSQSDPNGFIANAGQSSTAFSGYNTSCYYLNVSISNVCGSRSENLTICLNSCFAKYTVFPNPAKDYITVEFDQIESAESMPDEIVLLSEKSTKPVMNIDVQALYQRNGLKNGKQVEIDAKALPRGTYYLHIKNSRLKENKVDIIRILLE